MKTNKLISIITIMTMILSMLPTFTVTAEEGTYTCDFTQLIKNSADTVYGTATDIYELDEYTKAYLTYEGTYITADGKLFLKSSTTVNGAGKYKKGSYIAFTAPSDGSIVIDGTAIGVCIGDENSDTYAGYNNNFEIKAGQTMYAGYRKAETYIKSFTFTPAPEPTPTPTADPDSTEKPSFNEPEREIIYKEDFEGYSDGSNGGWESPAGTAAVKTDSDSMIKKYLTLTSGKSGTARSGYKEISPVSENFVLEADIKSTAYASNVSAFEVLEQKSSLYMNHGCYSNGKYIFKMNRPSGLNKYVINNAVSDSAMSFEKYDKPAVVTNDIPDTWLHVKVIGSFDNHTATAYITSLDRETVYYHGRTDMSPDISSFRLLALLAPSSGVDTCIDNIVISKALESDLQEEFYTVTISDGISEFSQYVYTGENVTNIPDVSFYGKHFLGWNVNGALKSSAELAELAITEDSAITAKVSADYIENLASVEFNSFPADNQLMMGSSGDVFADNVISLSITGERGTSLVTNPDSRVTDYKIDWKLDGFRTMNGNPTGESGEFPGTQLYCDSYGRVTVNKTNQTSINFELKNTSANYYGLVTATVTYNGKSITVSKPLVLLADASRDSNIILPKSGYTADYNKYSSVLTGYRAEANDILLGGWSSAGSDVSYIDFESDSTGQYLRLSRALSGNSSYIYQTIGDITSQTVFGQDIRFGMGGNITYGTGKAVTELSSTAFELGFGNSAFTFNGTQVCAGETGKWYHIEITADPTTKLCYAKIYNYKADGNYSAETPVGVTDTVSFNSGYTSGEFYRITLSKERGNVDINNVTVRKTQINEETMLVTAPETVNIPETDTVTAELTVTAKTIDGDTAIGMATWEIADEFATGVSVVSTGAGSAILTVDSTAASGEIPVRVMLNGISVTKTIRLIGTKDNVAFVEAPLGASIPASGTNEYTYRAIVRNGNADIISARAVAYALYNETNTSPVTSEGITLSSDGKLIITSDAAPQTVCVVASSTDGDGNTISKAIKVNVYNLKFDFGSGNPANGFTAVTASLSYNDNRGFGVTGTASDNASTLSGSDFGFRVKLEKGNVYNVTITYKGTIKCERIDSELTGFEKTMDSLAKDTYKVAVFGDGVMDITFSGEGEIDSISIEKVEREANSKPAWWTIGDSTVQQNGSWGYTIASVSTTDLSRYPELGEVVSAFYNSGRAGRQHRSYYTEGLLNDVLCGIKPGDVVSISGMGTNDSGADKEDFKRYNNQYIDAVEAMGGNVILGSYTPSGNYGATEGKVYDADNILFRGMRTNSYDTAIREVYTERVAAGDEKLLGFIDIGRIADNLMTSDVRTVYNAAADSGKDSNEARAAAQAKADELMAMWKDYNHYYTDFSDYILAEITSRAAQLISGEEQAELPSVIELKYAKEPAVPNSINVLSTAFENGNIVVTIDSGFTDTAIAAMYSASGELVELFAEDDNSKAVEFVFTATDAVNGGIIRLLNWDSLNTMKPIGKAIEIAVDEIGGVILPDNTIEITSAEEYIDVTSLEMYGNSTYRMYTANGYTDVTAESGMVHNTTGTEVTVVPVYRFEFTNTAVGAELNGYVKVGASSYTEANGYGLINADYAINENGCKPIDGRPVKADVPDGYYDIAVYRKGGVRADIYNNGVLIINNTNSAGSQNRPSESAVMKAPRVMVTDGINLTFGNTQGNNERIAAVEIVRIPAKYKKSVIWIAGDSESANYYPVNADGDDLDSEKIMMTGFGMQLEKFLSDKYAVSNYGQPSATVKTWYTECFESVNTLMQKGDTILIDFGINEVASSSNSITIDEMKQYMQTVIEAAKAKGVAAVLMSPVYNGKYQHKSYFTYSAASKENEITAFASEMGVECIDLNKYTQLYVNDAITATGDENWRTNNYHVADNLHLTQHSALLTASFIAAQIKSMGYATTDYAYTYKDISAVNTDNTRGAESGVTRVYSVAEAERYIAANTEAEPVSVRKWDFTVNDTVTEGDNAVVLSGNVAWNETYRNLKFDANTQETGAALINLAPAIANNVTAGFDLYATALGQQYFEYSITDTEGNNIVNCRFDAYNKAGTLTIGNTAVAADSDLINAISTVRDDGMTGSVTGVANEINFDTDTVTVTIGSTVFTGSLTGAETGTVAKLEFISSRSKTADRSIYLDNISLKEYKSNGSVSGESAFPDYAFEVYQSNGDERELPYRIFNPNGENIPVVIYLHGETRKGYDNEGQMYNARYMFDEIRASQAPCVLVAPQCPTDSSWSDVSDMISGIVAGISNADTDRIYLVGYSEGADACYDLLATGDFAAAIAISSSGNTAFAQEIATANAGVMIINGSEDDATVPGARAMAKALNDAGSTNTEMVELYSEGSNIQEKTATKEGVLDWLFSKSLTKNADVTSKTVDLAIFMGQSNMAGRGSYADATAVPVGHGYEFRSVTQPDMLFNITGPFGKNENNDTVNDNSGQGVDRRSGDMVSSVMASYYNETGVPVVGVQCSRGGTNTGYWTGSAVKAEAQSRLRAAKTYLEENGYTINHVFMVWCQGESDGDKINSGSQTVDGYKSATLSIFNYMKEVGVTDMFIVRTGHYNGSDDPEGTHDAAYVLINEAQADLADENKNIYVVGSLLDYQDNMIDAYHYNQTAYNEVGTAAGKAIAEAYAE